MSWRPRFTDRVTDLMWSLAGGCLLLALILLAAFALWFTDEFVSSARAFLTRTIFGNPW